MNQVPYGMPQRSILKADPCYLRGRSGRPKSKQQLRIESLLEPSSYKPAVQSPSTLHYMATKEEEKVVPLLQVYAMKSTFSQPTLRRGMYVSTNLDLLVA